MSAMAKGTRALVNVLSKGRPGNYVLFSVDRGDDGIERYASDQISLARAGLNVLVRSGFGSVATSLGKALDSLEGGYLVLTEGKFDSGNGPRTTWVWQVLAGDLLPLPGDQAWQVLQQYPAAQGFVWLSEETRYEDAWTLT